MTPELRRVPSLQPSAVVERSSAAMASVPEPPPWTGGHLSRSPRVHTLLVSSRYAHLQRPHPDPMAPEHATAGLLDPRHLSAVSRLFVPAPRQKVVHSMSGFFSKTSDEHC